MTLANDSVNVTPGSGATAATHAVGGKEHSVLMGAKGDGNLYRTGDVYTAISFRSVQLFNEAGSGKKVTLLGTRWFLTFGDYGTEIGIGVAMFRVNSFTEPTFGRIVRGDGYAGAPSTEIDTNEYPSELYIAKLNAASPALPSTVRVDVYVDLNDIADRQIISNVVQIYESDTNPAAYVLQALSNNVILGMPAGAESAMDVPEGSGVAVQGSNNLAGYLEIIFSVE